MKHRFFLASLFLISCITWPGCISLSTSNAVRIDEGMIYEQRTSERGEGSIHKWVLPEKRSINRIEIYFDPTSPLKNITVYAQLGTDNWRRLKEVKTSITTSPYVIHTALSTDAIRIVQSSSVVQIEHIALYGTKRTGAASE